MNLKACGFLNGITNLVYNAFDDRGNVEAVGYNNMQVNIQPVFVPVNHNALVKEALLFFYQRPKPLARVAVCHAGNPKTRGNSVADKLGKITLRNFYDTEMIFQPDQSKNLLREQILYKLYCVIKNTARKD
jgi:hypothetical protein